MADRALLRSSPWLGAAALFVGVAAAHAAGTALVYQFNHLTSAGEVFFSAAGVTVAVLLLVPRRWWLVVLAATFASELAADVILGEVAVTAAAISTTVTADTTVVTVQVTDDGAGFDPAIVQPGHLGLRTMRERADAIGASFEVASAPGAGTTLRLHIARPHAVPQPATSPAAAPQAGGPAT